MAKVSITTLKNYFKNGLKPTQTHFWNWLDSFIHKDDSIPIENIENLDNALQNKADSSQFNNHTNDLDAHGLERIRQTFDLYMQLSHFVDSNGLIKADKIQNLAKLNNITPTEESIENFIENHTNYLYQKSDLIWILNEDTYSVFVYIGDDKTEINSYRAIGLTNLNTDQINGLKVFVENITKIREEGLRLSLLNDTFNLKRVTFPSTQNSPEVTEILQSFPLEVNRLKIKKHSNNGLPNTLRNNGINLIYQDENGIDKTLSSLKYKVHDTSKIIWNEDNVADYGVTLIQVGDIMHMRLKCKMLKTNNGALEIFSFLENKEFLPLWLPMTLHSRYFEISNGFWWRFDVLAMSFCIVPGQSVGHPVKVNKRVVLDCTYPLNTNNLNEIFN